MSDDAENVQMVPRQRKLMVAPYFMHNIDGRRCGVVVATSKRVVARAFRIAESEIEKMPWKHTNVQMQDGIILAAGRPGTMFVLSIRDHPEGPWSPGQSIPTGATP